VTESALAVTEGEIPQRGLSVAGSFSGALVLAEMTDEQFDLSLRLLRKAQDRLLKIMHDVMREGVDYGNVPGVDKPSLAQPGAETLCNLFHLVPELKVSLTRGDGVTSPALYFDASCDIHAGSVEGPVVGTGHGICHSWEAKYRYRNAERVCPKCGKGTIIKGKAEYGGGWICFAKKGGCGAKFGDQDSAIVGQTVGQVENPDPWDLANTLEKMALKRAHVDATKRTTGASAIFTQDLEEQGALPEAPQAEPPAPRQTLRDRAAASRTPPPEPPPHVDADGVIEGEAREVGDEAPGLFEGSPDAPHVPTKEEIDEAADMAGVDTMALARRLFPAWASAEPKRKLTDAERVELLAAIRRGEK
jgi:hypothetical protein